MRESFQTLADDRTPSASEASSKAQEASFAMSDSAMLKINDSAMAILSEMQTRTRDQNAKHSLFCKILDCSLQRKEDEKV